MKQVIISNYKDKTMTLMPDDGNFTKKQVITGPYLAMYNYRYRGFKWTNWEDFSNQEITLKAVQDISKEYDWEEYVFSIIVKEGTTFEQMTEIVNITGFCPDYFLMKEKGPVSLLHQTDYFDSLVKNGYVLTDYIHGEGNFSFGRGVYCLDKGLAPTDNTWQTQENVYSGTYDGEYLRCIEDTQNGLKDGRLQKFQQEIIIPFNEKEIKWEVKE